MKILNFYFDSRISSKEKIALIKQFNFDGIFLMCDDMFDLNVKLAKENNIYIESAHLPYKNVCNSIWLEEDTGEIYTLKTISWIKRISLEGIKIAVIHMAGGLTPPKMSEIGFERFMRIVEACEKYNVTLAIENVHDWNYVHSCLRRANSNKVGICLDFGHANAFTQDIYDIDYKELSKKIVCLHIHDNFGEKDEHLIPFDGNIDYHFVLSNLKKYGYQGNLSLELECERLYSSSVEYVSKAKKAIDRLEEIYEK